MAHSSTNALSLTMVVPACVLAELIRWRGCGGGGDDTGTTHGHGCGQSRVCIQPRVCRVCPVLLASGQAEVVAHCNRLLQVVKLMEGHSYKSDMGDACMCSQEACCYGGCWQLHRESIRPPDVL